MPYMFKIYSHRLFSLWVLLLVVMLASVVKHSGELHSIFPRICNSIIYCRGNKQKIGLRVTYGNAGQQVRVTRSGTFRSQRRNATRSHKGVFNMDRIISLFCYIVGAAAVATQLQRRVQIY